MSDRQSRAYFERRAEQEQAAALQAASEPAAQRHRELAAEYRRLVLAPRPPSGGVVETVDDGILPLDFRLIP